MAMILLRVAPAGRFEYRQCRWIRLDRLPLRGNPGLTRVAQLPWRMKEALQTLALARFLRQNLS
jgi:hypothetical protein